MTPDQISRIVLLASPEETPPLGDFLRAHNPNLEIVGAHDRDALELACANPLPGTRLLSFCSPVIVPAAVLAALPGPSYNFHPGPPARPGRYPGVFAIYDGDKQFGITVHEMAPKVDSGAIVAVEWFDIAPDSDLAAVEKQTYLRLATMFRKLSKHLATRSAPLPRLSHVWSGRKTTRAEALALAQITADMNETEVARRRRACGQIATPPDDPGWPT